MDDILNSIKKQLGIESEYEYFDQELIININSAFMTLTQIGIGPISGFFIIGNDEKWSDFIGDDKTIEAIKTYTYLYVKLVFDPPANSFLIDSFNRTLKEIEWRLLLNKEGG